MDDITDITVPQAVLGVLGVVVVVSLVIAATTSVSAFGAFNYDWDGTADLRDIAADNTHSEILQNSSEYTTLEADSLVVLLGPDEAYTNGELAQMRRFVQEGGTLVVAGDFGPVANEVLAGVNASARIERELLRDERNYGRSPAFPTGEFTTNRTAYANLSTLALNYPASLRLSNQTAADVLATTSSYAYADTNRNGELDDSEQMRTYPIVSREPVGNGSVIAVSDPSIFINSMLDRGDNRAFAAALFRSMDHSYFDYTHAGGVPPLMRALLFLRSSAWAQFIAGVSLITLPFVVAKGIPALQARMDRESITTDDIQITESEVIALLRETHPEWERDRIERLARRFVEQRRD